MTAPAPNSLPGALLDDTRGDVGQIYIRKSDLYPCGDFRGVCE